MVSMMLARSCKGALFKLEMAMQTAEAAQVQFDLMPPSPEQLQKLVAGLSEEERHLLLEHGEEAPFCGTFLAEKREGLYTCRLCVLPLFKVGTKFESSTGW